MTLFLFVASFVMTTMPAILSLPHLAIRYRRESRATATYSTSTMLAFIDNRFINFYMEGFFI